MRCKWMDWLKICFKALKFIERKMECHIRHCIGHILLSSHLHHHFLRLIDFADDFQINTETFLFFFECHSNSIPFAISCIPLVTTRQKQNKNGTNEKCHDNDNNHDEDGDDDDKEDLSRLFKKMEFEIYIQISKQPIKFAQRMMSQN